MSHALTAHSIRYAGLVAASPDDTAARLVEKLPPLWHLSYRAMTGTVGGITQQREGSTVYQWSGDRMVVAYGFSHPSGPLDTDLLPHHPDLLERHQESWSSLGVSLRSMVQWCVDHPGTFFFARPIYLQQAEAPAALEFGVLRGPGDLWVERFAT